MKFYLQKQFCNDLIDVSIVDQTTSGARFAAQPVIMTTVQQGDFVAPAFRINAKEAQDLMDELWQCGLRPSEGTGSAGALSATERHLQDMRTLVFDKTQNIGQG
jgi:hypothetical protein